MNKKQGQVKGRCRKNLLIILELLVFFCAAGAVQAVDSRFQEVEGSNGSIVRDNNTGLEWQRCPAGQSWTGSGCSGIAWEGNWYNAMRVTIPDGFRVPTHGELGTINLFDPYNQTVFPGDGRFFWASLPPAPPGSSYADSHLWQFDKTYLDHMYNKEMRGSGRLRFVRGGQGGMQVRGGR